jgi:hypothetical protein
VHRFLPKSQEVTTVHYGGCAEIVLLPALSLLARRLCGERIGGA